MNRKFLTTAVVAALFACASPVITHAQSGSQDSGQAAATPAQNPAGPDLNLTDDQKAQIKQIRKDTKEKVQAVVNDTTLSPDQKQDKIKQLHREAHKQQEALLTPEQRKIDREWHQAHKAQQAQTPPPSSN